MKCGRLLFRIEALCKKAKGKQRYRNIICTSMQTHYYVLKVLGKQCWFLHRPAHCGPCTLEIMHKLICIRYHNIFKTRYIQLRLSFSLLYLPAVFVCACLYTADRYRKCCVRLESVNFLWQMVCQSVECSGPCIHQSKLRGAAELKCHNRLSMKECVCHRHQNLCV